MYSIWKTIYREADVFVTYKLFLICPSRCKKLWFWFWFWPWVPVLVLVLVLKNKFRVLFFLLLFLGESEAVFSVGIFLRMVPCFPLVLYSNLMISVILLPVLLYRRDCHWESVSSSLHTWIIYLRPFYFPPLLLILQYSSVFVIFFPSSHPVFLSLS